MVVDGRKDGTIGDGGSVKRFTVDRQCGAMLGVARPAFAVQEQPRNRFLSGEELQRLTLDCAAMVDT